MAKAISVALLFAAVAVVSATVPTVTTTGHAPVNVDAGAVATQVVNSHTALASGLTSASAVALGDLSSCKCEPKECKDKKEDICKVTTDVKEECKDVEVQKDFVQCDTKCFDSDALVQINVPTIDLSSFHGPAAQAVAAPKAGNRRLKAADTTDFLPGLQNGAGAGAASGAAGAGAASGAAGAGADGKQKVCREICKPGKRPVKEQQCEDVESKKYDCKERVVSSTCITKCKCNGNDVEIREVPDYHAIALAAAPGLVAGAVAHAASLG